MALPAHDCLDPSQVVGEHRNHLRDSLTTVRQISAPHALYPIFRSRSFRHLISPSFSMLLGGNPSTTPRTPRPCPVSAMTTSVGLAVAQKTRHTSGTVLIEFRMFTGYHRYSLDGTIYWVVARHKYGEDSGDPKRRQPASNASIIKSTDFGKTWTRSAKENYDQPMFPGSRFAAPYFVEYGQDGRASVDNADRYVYALSNDGFWDNGNNLILGRVARSKIGNLSASDWQYYRGGDGMEDSAWMSDMAGAKLVLDAPGRLGMNGAVWVPGLRRYIMIGWYYPAGGGKIKDACHTTNWDFYEAPKPWGPWTKVSTCVSSPQGWYSPQLCPKFTSEDGRRLFVMTAGDWNQPKYYRLTIVPLRVEGQP